jgi:fructokinase
VATAGEALVELVAGADGRFEPGLGGAAYNLTRALARQGVATLYLNPLSKDQFGRQLAKGLTDAGVQLAAPEPVTQLTSLAVRNGDANGHPDYAFYRQGVADRATTAAALTQACSGLQELSLVCTGSLALSPDDADIYLPWLASQRRAGRTVVIDAKLQPSVMPDLDQYRRHVLTALNFADVIKVSDEDLQGLSLPGANALVQARQLLKGSRASLLALTLGGQGAALLTRGGQLFEACLTEPKAVLHSVGEGDCF